MREFQLSSSFLGVVLTARVAFSTRSWPYVIALAVPWLLCAGQRCVTRLAALAPHPRHLASYYRFLSDGKFRLEVFLRCLFTLIVQTFPGAPLTLVVDDTLVPKWGRRIFGAGHHFDHTARPCAGVIWGHNWIVLAVVVSLGGRRWIALPFWVSLYRPQRVCAPGEFRTRHQLTVAALEVVRSWYSGPIVLLADGAYNNRALGRPLLALGLHFVSRLRQDAALREARPSRRRPGQRGRTAKWGPWLPPLRRLGRPTEAFTPITVAIYGRVTELYVREFLAYWAPLDAVVKIVITRDPARPKRVAYLMSTDVSHSAMEIAEYFARRWTIEHCFLVAKQTLGFGSPEVRKPHAVVRHAALTLASLTWTEVWWARDRARKARRSFNTALRQLREEVVADAIFASGPRTPGARRIAENVALLFSAATSVA